MLFWCSVCVQENYFLVLSFLICGNYDFNLYVDVVKTDVELGLGCRTYSYITEMESVK